MRIHHLYIRKRRWLKELHTNTDNLLIRGLLNIIKNIMKVKTFNDEYSDLIKDGLDINTAQGLIKILLEYGNVL